MTDRDRTRRIAIVDLLAMPDQELVTRAHVLTCPGDEHRYELIPELALSYAMHAQPDLMRETEPPA